jgi:hypothetical protein
MTRDSPSVIGLSFTQEQMIPYHPICLNLVANQYPLRVTLMLTMPVAESHADPKRV